MTGRGQGTEATDAASERPVRYWLVKYLPAVLHRNGEPHPDGRPPYADHSHYPEPDFSGRYATVSSICRGGQFAPHVTERDRIVYLTWQERNGAERIPHWRLAAVLCVVKRLESHVHAAVWFGQRALPIPGNCVLPGAPSRARDEHEAYWEERYRERAEAWPMFFLCRCVACDLHTRRFSAVGSWTASRAGARD